MKYQDCCTQELKAFVADRKLVLPPDTDTTRHARARRAYIRTLHEADRERTFFRFMELPPELRNRIYSFLTNAGNLTTWNPQIIATSKQVQNEATGLAHKETWFNMTIGMRKVRVQGVTCGTYDPAAIYGTSLNLLRWPPFPLKVCRLKIKVDALKNYGERAHRNYARPRSTMSVFNNILYSLCTYLAETGKLTSIQLDLPLDYKENGIESKHVGSLCYPLRLLSTLTTIEIPGVNATILEAIKADTIKARPHKTALVGSEGTVDNAPIFSILLRQASEILFERKHILDGTRRGETGKVMDLQWETSVLGHIGSMEKLMSVFEAVDLDRLAKLLKEEKASRREWSR